MIDANKLKSVLKNNAEEAERKLTGIRADIQQINDEIHWLEHSPLPLSDALENIGKFVESNSSHEGIESFFFNEELAGLDIFESKVRLRHGDLVSLEGSGVIGSGKVSISKIMCSLFGSNIQIILEEMAKKSANDIESGPPFNERAQLKASLLQNRKKFEIDEEALISTAEELGFNGLYRRFDCDPKIVLMMEAS
jgi:hypothetical protein